MRRVICVGCGVAEDLDNPTGDIRTMQLVDMTEQWSNIGQPEKAVQEDICSTCRKKLREEFFNVSNAEPLDIPLMKVV